MSSVHIRKMLLLTDEQLAIEVQSRSAGTALATARGYIPLLVVLIRAVHEETTVIVHMCRRLVLILQENRFMHVFPRVRKQVGPR